MYVDSTEKAAYVIQGATQWIKGQVENAGAEGTVVGLSGGIDSSVTAALCKEAFPENTLALIMPCHSDTQDEKDASLLAREMNIEAKTVNLTPAYDAVKNNLDEIEKAPDMALANIKPRLRMTVLYYYAQTLNYLVIGTGNKSENILGYFTKYGDGAVDLAPLAKLTKMEVYKLGEVLHIPDPIMQKPPSAGIIRGQTDEEELGFSYEVLEQYFRGEEIDLDLKAKIEKLIDKSEHKRALPPEFHPEKSTIFS